MIIRGKILSTSYYLAIDDEKREQKFVHFRVAYSFKFFCWEAAENSQLMVTFGIKT